MTKEAAKSDTASAVTSTSENAYYYEEEVFQEERTCKVVYLNFEGDAIINQKCIC